MTNTAAPPNILTHGVVVLDDAALLERCRTFVSDAQLALPRWKAEEPEKDKFFAKLAEFLTTLPTGLPVDQILPRARTIGSMMIGLGVLSPFLEQPGIEEVIVRGNFVQLERNGKIEDIGPVADEQYFHDLAAKAADMGRRRMSASAPYTLVDIPGGHRFTAIVEPLSVAGTAINIRVFQQERMSLDELVRRDALPAQVADFLRWVVANNLATVLFSGKFSSGKTTLLNAVSGYFPTFLQLAVAETFEELKLRHPHPVRVVVKAGEDGEQGGVTMRDVIRVLYTRMRPDVVIVGEIVADESAEFLTAINLGNKAYATIHGNSAYDSLLHLEELVPKVGWTIQDVRLRIARGVNLVIHTTRTVEGRRYVQEVMLLKGLRPDGDYDVEYLYQSDHRDVDLPGEMREIFKTVQDKAPALGAGGS